MCRAASPNPSYDHRPEKRARRIREIGDLEEGRRQHRVMFGGPVQFANVPVDKSRLGRPLSLDARVLEIATQSDLPRNVDDVGRSLEKPLREALPARGEDFGERQRLEASDRHALSVDRIETADGVAKNEKPFWETRQLLVVAAQVRLEVVGRGADSGSATLMTS